MKYLHILCTIVIVLSVHYSSTAQRSDKSKFPKLSPDLEEIEPHFMGKQIKDRFIKSGANWQIPISVSLTEPIHFPYQNANKNYLESFPAMLVSGQLLFAWATNDTIYCTQSSDTGLTWGPSILITSGGNNPFDLSGICTSTGRVIAVWQAGQGLEMSYSDDNGINWSIPNTITYDGEDRVPTITQTLDEKIWLVYCRSNPNTDWDIYYKTSINNGISWSSEQTLVASPFNDGFGQIVSGNIDTLLAVYRANANNSYDIYQKTSSDGGLTWSATSPILNSPLSESIPRILRQSNGTLWMIYYLYEPTPILPEYFQWNLYYIQSFDGGNTWTAPTEFTRYVEYDGWHNATLVNNQPFVSFASTRWNQNREQRHLWYGIIGITQDTNPPPALFNMMIGTTTLNDSFTIQAFVDDETGISDVQLLYSVNDKPSGPVQMYDDGLHNDENPGDNIWGTSIDPLQYEDVIEYSATITDITTNTVNVYGQSYEIGLVHDVGNVILNFRTNSQLGDQAKSFGSNACWPRVDGDDYLFCGGLWVGAEVWGEYRVMNFHYEENYIDWTQTPGSIVTLEPGLSDQDGNVTYDDQIAESPPIGLQVHQKSYQWSNATRDDFIIFDYSVKNKGVNGDLNNVFTAVWLDPDLIEAGDDLGGYDNQRGLIYLYDSQSNPDGYIGLKLLGAGNIPFTARVDPGPSVPRDDFGRHQFMTSGFPTIPTNPDDYNMLLTSQPFSLTAGDSHSVAFGLVMGGSLGELQANADTMQFIYNNDVQLPTITVLDDTLDFGQVFLGVTDSLELMVENTGTRELHIFEALAAPVEYNVTPMTASINPGESKIFTVNFSPQVIGNYPGTLEIICNDPSHDTCVVMLKGQGVEAPVISVLPDSLSENLETGQTSTQTITITNTGGSDLVFFISAESGSNYALQFDGLDDYLIIPDDLISSNVLLTLEAWFNTKSSGVIIGYQDTEYPTYPFDWVPIIYVGIDEKLHGEYWQGSANPITTDSIMSDGLWHHVSLVGNLTTQNMYLDGMLIGTLSGTINHLGMIKNLIGLGYTPGWPWGNGDWFFYDGLIDEVRIWNIALTQLEIQADMNHEISGTEPGLVAYWRFNEGSGNKASDQTSNGKDGTLYGGAAWVVSTAPFWPAWLSVKPDSGICAPDSSEDILVSFNATNLDSGDYDATIVFVCNDPATPEDIVPIHLHVSPATGIEDQITEDIPKRYMLYQNYPNPFNPTTIFEFDLPKTSQVILKIFNILGEDVATLVSDRLTAGSYSYDWDAGNLASGLYFYRFQAGDFVKTRKMILIR